MPQHFVVTTVQCSICSQLNNNPRIVVTEFRLPHSMVSLSGGYFKQRNIRTFSPVIIIKLLVTHQVQSYVPGARPACIPSHIIINFDKRVESSLIDYTYVAIIYIALQLQLWLATLYTLSRPGSAEPTISL